MEAFRIFDEDGSGSLDVNELREAVKKYGTGTCTEEDLEAIVQQMDKDGDGTIDLDEFVKVMSDNHWSG